MGRFPFSVESGGAIAGSFDQNVAFQR